ncbi:MAG: patatin-like phospholipase family protein [Polyangiaceae bacterium]|jgi:NTE family protein|nr:patatin-like phospholipase family protein [Polyangiaceae bacterium]
MPHRSKAKRKQRIGLVLGAGGPVGHAFHAGVLQALHDEVCWDPREADVVVGTSAGAQVGALLRAGMSGAALAARASGHALDDEAHAIAQHWVRPCAKTPDPSLPKTSMPASFRFFLNALTKPQHWRPGRVVSALLPPGRVRLDPMAEGLRRMFGEAWPERDLWITSVHLDTGQRVAFGAPGAPSIDVGTAVTCSGAVPGVHAPVQWDGCRYVDGGMASATHLDLLTARDLDLVIVSSPLSMYAPMRALLRREVKALERCVPVISVEPDAEALEAMGRNPMDTARALGVAKAARETTAALLARRDVRGKTFGVF